MTRLYFMRLRRVTQEALTHTHFLDLPILLVMVALGAIKPDSWRLFIIGTFVALLIATALTIYIPRLYSWGVESKSKT